VLAKLGCGEGLGGRGAFHVDTDQGIKVDKISNDQDLKISKLSK
jgi:hypothetical protein